MKRKMRLRIILAFMVALTMVQSNVLFAKSTNVVPKATASGSIKVVRFKQKEFHRQKIDNSTNFHLSSNEIDQPHRGKSKSFSRHPNLSAVSVVQQWDVFEVSFTSDRKYSNPFLDVQVDVLFSSGNKQWLVPAFWAGGNHWKVRFAPPTQGKYKYRAQCTDKLNLGLNGKDGSINVVGYKGVNPLRIHGFIRVADDNRHFEYADGTSFLWLADTWWKNLCKGMTWNGFQELTADRKAKGFNAVQIVCGPYPDEGMMEARWENEGGKPYDTIDFSVMNPKYFEFADRRIKHLVDNGIVPVIVGGWGRPQGKGKSTLEQVGLDGYKRHWRNLIAHFGAFPTVWIVGGEVRDAYGPWSELAKYLKQTDPYHHPLTYHAPQHPREMLKDNAVFDFDMIALGHEGFVTAAKTLELMKSCRSQVPAKPVLCGEASYEGHMQTNFQDVQRHLFWSFMLNGAAGHTYGAAGIWQASVEGNPGIEPVYDWTTWKEGMNYPGSTQLGIGKKLLEQYDWSRFELHPEWADKDCFSAGIPVKVRFIYQPKHGIYKWDGPEVMNLEPDIDWHVYYWDPATGRKFDQGVIKASAKNSDKDAKMVSFKKNVPSPQDWVLVVERVHQK